MLDDLLEEFLDAWLTSRGTSKRTQLVARVFFGLLGVALSVAGIHQMTSYDAALHFRVAAMALLASLAFFCAFNVTLLLPWRWPGRLFVVSFVALFVVRIVLGP